MKQNNTISYPAIGNHRKVGNPMELNERYAEIIERYPEYVTQKQMIEICGICAKTAYNLERRGVIPYTVEVIPTGRIHKIKLLDVIAYLHQKGNLYCEDQRVNDDLYQFFKSEMENLPDLMRTKQIRSFTGFSTTAIQRWVLEKRLTALLDILAEKMNCTYLSDLRFLSQPNAALRQAVASMPLDDFSEYEWKDAAEYLCGVSCASAKEARDTILKRA